jgi:alkylation response protein AidB-like acyl-CoA dehydrogenase
MIDLTLTDEQRQIVESAAGLLAAESPVSRLRPSGRAVDIHPLLADWGWFGAGLPDAEGGMGLSLAEETLLYLEAGRHLLSPSVLATTLAARLAVGAARAALLEGAQRAAFVLPLAGGEAYAFDAAGAAWLVGFGEAEIWLGPAEAHRGAPVRGLDETVAIARGPLDTAARIAAAPLDHAMLLIAAMLAGSAQASCELAVEYAKVRQQFGQPIGAFQAVKHMCADMGVRAYAAEAQVKVAAAAACDDPASAGFQIRAAAHTALRAARDNAADAIQVHGGIGFTAECDVHFHLKRAHLLGRLMGGPQALGRDLLAAASPEPA